VVAREIAGFFGWDVWVGGGPSVTDESWMMEDPPLESKGGPPTEEKLNLSEERRRN